jgi:hypothetical protein
MGRVIEVKFQAPVDRGVYFPGRKMHFPPLRRCYVEWKPDLSEFGVNTPQPPESQEIVYTIDAEWEAMAYGAVQSTIVKSVAEEAGRTVVIRHHTSEERAFDYVDGLFDAGVPEWDIDQIVRTEQGIFTLFRRPTPENSKGGPFVFHIGSHWVETTSGLVEDKWECRTHRSGKVEVGAFLQVHCN